MSADGKQRLFIAIPIPAEIRDALAGVQEELQQVLTSRQASWIRPDNLHLTIRFLGDVADQHVQALQAPLHEVARASSGMALACERLGCFPDLRFPRVLWAWVHDEADHLVALVRRIDGAVAEMATHRMEERFVGHVTLARLRQIRRSNVEPLAGYVNAAVARKFGAWRAGRFDLVRSELSAQGSRYTILGSFELQ